MDCGDRVDDRTFKVSFTTEGVDKLRERLKDKLKEILHDYTDDTLVEYVIVLIKNGRHKDEARNELNVFLGDCTNSFVSWLWDHLGSNLGLYIQPQDSHPVAVSKTKPSSGEQVGKNNPYQIDSESGKGKPKRESRSRHNREWKDIRGDAGEPPLLQSSETENIYKEEKTHEKVVRKKRSLSPQPIAQKKRIRLDEGQQKKRELPSQAVGAPRRLLQFAVRDAVTTLKHSTTESLKQIRSVVSASTGDSSLEEHPQRIRSIARVPNPMAAAIRAVAEAAEDVTKIRSSRNVFDRLGCGTTVSGSFDQQLELSEPPIEDEEFRDVDQFQLEKHSSYVKKNDYREQKNGKFNMLESDTRMASDYASDNETYDNSNIGNRDSVARNAGDMKSRSRMGRDQPSSVSNTSSKIVNISVDVNTWKPPVRQDSRKTRGMDNRRSVQNDKVGTNVSATQPMKENNASPVTIGNENARPPTDVQREAQKSLPSNSGLYSTSRPTEDVDARIIFVNNVHFAATKDSLSRHFNKFGEVLKVMILTDASTAQPKGSAYVEFMRKEAAEHALSLDGTSFMSRILKVVRKSSAPQEATATVTWPRVVRGSPLSASRFARVPFPRGISSIYRPRIPVKPGARSLQWTRDAQSTSTESSAPASTNSMLPSSTRSLTYVRPDPKANGNTGVL